MSQPLLINDLSKVLIQDDCTLESCLKGLSAGGYQISLVQRSDGRMAGIVTDSDVRKALLRGVGLSDSIHLVLNDKPKVIRQSSLPATDISSLMKSFNVFHLPILDDSNNFVGLYITSELAPKNTLSETVVIMAGGKGKRLMPLTANTPKPMLIVKGKPMLEHILLQLKQDGFKNIVISVNYLSESITSYFKDGQDFGLNITYIHEDKPLGTAGALYSLPPELRGKSIIVTNADILTGVSYLDLLMYSTRHSCDGLMAVRTQEWQNPFGVVQSKDCHITDIVEKPIHRFQVNAGLYVLSNKLLDLLQPDKYCDMPDLFRTAIDEGLDLQLYPLHEPWLDIGRINDYQEANNIS